MAEADYLGKNLVFVHSEPGHSEPTLFKGRFIGEQIRTTFKLKDGNTKTWQVNFKIEVSDLGTPRLLSVEVTGSVKPHPKPLTRTYTEKNIDDLINISKKKKHMFTKKELEEYRKLIPEPESVGRWQLKVVEQYRAQLFELALMSALRLGKPEKEKLPNGEYRIHWLPGMPLEGKELKELQKEVGTTIRQKITPDFLKSVAGIYLEALKRDIDPNPEIMSEYKCKKRTAQEWTQKARELGFLPPAQPGRISSNKSVATKKKTNKRKEK